MEQNLRQLIKRYHDLVDGKRCESWQLEEFIVKAIRSDTTANHLPKWKEGGHDDKKDILIIENGKKHHIQVKSGQFNKNNSILTLSGYRLGRFKGDFGKITEYLNGKTANYIATPYRKVDDASGRSHIYRLCYINHYILGEIDSNNWRKQGASYKNQNQYGVIFSLSPSMSWQIWWKIPISCIDMTDEFTDGRIISS
ncbi:MAG: hypothetical protein OXC03_11100 [Flavobacteriaceae bacterium]|nr:hypothetical protein [Flavobacteriaceae bacterium]